jgi:hypothetical protein
VNENFNRPPGVHPEWVVVDGDTRSLRLPTMPPPLVPFDGYLKQLAPAGLSGQLTFLLHAAFPEFLEGTVDPPLDSSTLRSASTFDLGASDYVRRRRRYSGIYLPGSRYYTVSHDPRGDDGGTLLRELSAYADPAAGGVVFDAVDCIGGLGFRGQDVEPEQALTLRMFVPTGPCRAVNPQILRAWLEVFGQATIPDSALSLLLALPYTISHHRIDRVLDLREIDAQDWLLSFCTTDHDILKKDNRASISAFHQLLPALLAQSLGGNIVTDAIGSYLRLLGVNGLVFPSARRDSFVSYSDGHVADFIGWNFVDYRGAALSQACVFHDMSPGWAYEVPAASTLEIIETGPHARSWRLNGMSEHTTLVLQGKFSAFMGDYGPST